MNTNRISYLITAVFGLAALSTFGCSKKSTALEAPSLSSDTVITTTVTTAAPEPRPTTQVTTTTSPDVTSVQWSDFKENTYDTRAQLFAGLKLLEAKVDSQISELTAKRAAMNSTANTKDWDFAMKEMGNARTYLKSASDEMNKATPETWNQGKDKVGQAWVRTQDAYAKVKASTTT